MLVVVLLLVAVVTYYFGINRLLGLPPGPPPLPLIGNMLSFQWDIDKVFLKWKAQYGRIFTVWLPYPMVIIGDRKVLQEHIVKNGDVFLAKKNPEQMMEIIAGGQYGLAFEDNSMVKEQRKFAMKTLHEIGFGSAALEDSVYHYALEAVTRWKKAGDKEVDVTENIMRVIGNIIWNVTFGITLEFDNPAILEFRRVMKALVPLLANPFMMFLEFFPAIRKIEFIFGNPASKLKAASTESHEMLKEGIRTTEKTFNPDNEPSCYIEAFLVEQRRREEAGIPIGNFHYEQMLNSAATLWAAGFDTTVSTLRMACLQLVNNPEAQKKIQKEIDDAIGDRRIRFDDHKQLHYLSAFLQEVFRVVNVLPFNFRRKTTQETEIEGYSIPLGTTILPQFSMVHTDPTEFERPDYFCAERHLDAEGHFVKDPRITPFSLGKRACLGESLARMEVFVLIATFEQHCHFEPIGKIPPPVEFTAGFSRSVKDFRVKIRPRNAERN